jgi:hypothetical protein
MDGDFWLRTAGMLAFVTVLFVYPVVSLYRDDRRRSREQADGQQILGVEPEQHS